MATLTVVYQYMPLPGIFGAVASMEGNSLGRTFPLTATCEFLRHGPLGTTEAYYVDCQLGGSRMQQVINVIVL